MAISERINPDNLNIHQFQETPEGRPELPFDVDRDISHEMKQRLMDHYKDQQTLSHSTLTALRDVKFLWSELGDLLSNFSDQELIDWISHNKGLDFFYVACDIKCIRPNIKINVTPDQLSTFRGHLESVVHRGIKCWDVIAYNVIDPEHKYTLTLEDVDDANQIIEDSKRDNSWHSVAYYSAGLRLADPNPNYQSQFSSDDWDKLQKELKNHEDDLDIYAALASYLKILAAHSVKITSPGVIEFQMYPPDTINQPTPPMPETRKF